jgi:OOP family OmpA-OmpF porin
MRSSFVKTPATLAAACVVALGVFSAANAQVRDEKALLLVAQVRDGNEKALLLDTRGAPVMNATGLCWHTAYGPPPMWTSGCHAEGPAPVAQHVTPVARPAATVALMPQPAPVGPAASAALLPAYEKVAFEANILFDSNKSALTAAGRTTLDSFVGELGGLDTQSVRAIGYADRMGSEAFNQILSEQRVDAVKTYLVKKGVAADRVRTSAWGEARPSTAAGDCKGANNMKNVACMQPDRRVFIEISGSRLAK